jgi:HAD superfamily hydrolase (TIGR01509 family)
MMRTCEAVVFDMDGLLLDSEAVYHRAWTVAAREHGYELSDAVYRGFVGQRIALCEERLAAMAGAGFSLASFRARWRVLWREIAARGVAPKPGALELLALLERAGVPRAIATSSQQAEAALALGALAPRFAAVITGDQVANGKPAPDIYLAAARALGVDPARCLAFEDSENGARSALAAGMRLIIVPDLVEPSDETKARAHAVFRSLAEASALVAQLLTPR